MSVIVTATKDGLPFLYFKVVEDKGHTYVERPDSPSIKIPKLGNEFEALASAILLIGKEREE